MSRLASAAALALGLLVAVLSLVQSERVSRLFGGDYLNVALTGFAVAVSALLVATQCRGQDRALAGVGAVLGLVPVGLLIFYLSRSAG